jgi:diguanylate cyclase (GGDEF)-like protein
MPFIEEEKFYKRFVISVTLAVILCLSGIFIAGAVRTRQLINEENLIRARTLFNSVLLTRKWNAHYGGVYVEKKEGVESNPYLTDPEIRTIDGKTYTLKNPALMTREISAYAEKEGLFKFHITSLNPLNPANKSDEFEKQALVYFERGEKEKYTTEKIQNRTYFRYMAPLYVEKDCLQCHEKQGYKIGQVRGGISVTFDIEDILSTVRTNIIAVVFFGVAVTGALLGLIFFSMLKLVRRIQKVRQEIEKMAITDMLTEVFSRGHLVDRFTEEFERARRLNKNLSCIILDIDHFKAVNDKYGHLAGDKVLKEITDRIKSTIRAYDILGRYGGEEFLIVSPEADFNETIKLAERIRNIIRENLIEGINVTVSQGMSGIHKEDKSIDDIIKRADDLLYKAKTAGRDRIEWIM